MKFKLGIIGHHKRFDTVISTEKEYSQIIEFHYIKLREHVNHNNLIDVIKSYEGILDGIIFTGHILYDAMIKEFVPSIPWDYLHRDDNQLITALLQTSLEHNIKNSRISLDSYSQNAVNRVLKTIGYEDESPIEYLAKRKTLSDDLMTYILDFHLKNFQSGKVDLCITGLANIHGWLVERGIPAYCLSPTRDIVIETINRILLKAKALQSESSQIVVLSVEIDSLNEYSLFEGDEYMAVIDKMTLSKEIYHFAQKLQGAVVEDGKRGYFIFTTRNILERETANLKRLRLLRIIEEIGISTISIGVGFGNTVREAKQHAIKGVRLAKKNGGNQGYVLYSKDKIIGPVYSKEEKTEEDTILLDDFLYKISERSELSINSIFKLYSIIKQANKNTFTSKELSELYDVTPRSMNRIIDKLVLSGHANIIGKKVIGNAGRPSRVIELIFDID